MLLLLLLSKAINPFDSHYQLNEAPPLEVLPFRNRIETYTQKKRKYIFLFASWSKKPRANQMARRFLPGVEKTIKMSHQEPRIMFFCTCEAYQGESRSTFSGSFPIFKSFGKLSKTSLRAVSLWSQVTQKRWLRNSVCGRICRIKSMQNKNTK